MTPKPFGILGFAAIAIFTLIPSVFAQQMPGMTGMSGQSTDMGNMTMNQMVYDVMINGIYYKIMISSNGVLPTNVQFNQGQKSLSFDVSGLTSRNLVHYEVTIPATLLSGNFTVMLGGMQVNTIPEGNDTSTTIHINVPSSFIKANSIGDSSVMTVTSTQVVPEFPASVTIITLVAFSILITNSIRSKLIN